MVVINIYAIFKVDTLLTLNRHALPTRGCVSLDQSVRVAFCTDGATHVAGGG